MTGFKKISFLYEIPMSLLLELGGKGLYEETNVFYWEQLEESQGDDLLDMEFLVDSCNKEKQTITIRVTGYIEDNKDGSE